MALPARKPLSVEAYLRLEQESPVKHEYVGGVLHAMAGASTRHNRIAVNLVVRLAGAAERTACQVYVSDMKVQIGDVFYYPDVMVTCEPGDDETYYKTQPCLLVEILSPSTANTDRREKLHAYRQIPSLRDYLIVSVDEPRVERHYRNAAGEWWVQDFLAEGVMKLECPGLELRVADLYQGL